MLFLLRLSCAASMRRARQSSWLAWCCVPSYARAAWSWNFQASDAYVALDGICHCHLAIFPHREIRFVRIRELTLLTKIN
mmetsp:Transcript_8519/g.30370  ORF Transcript_8519/g.30370 Transcript_8519/m.30370 type:complete len:80 (-) Transcript_8519:279-518(-)